MPARDFPGARGGRPGVGGARRGRGGACSRRRGRRQRNADSEEYNVLKLSLDAQVPCCAAALNPCILKNHERFSKHH